jgi:hypothetical protein
MKASFELLNDFFSNANATVIKAANYFDVNEKTIRRWLIYYGIKTRPISETASLRQSVSKQLTQKGIEVLNGELLGDGCLISRSVFSARYTHTNKHKEYLLWLKNILENEGVVFSESAVCGMDKGKYFNYGLRSRSQFELKPLFDRFYPKEKIVPHDLELTPTSCLHWYLGDGSKPKNWKGVILLPLSFHVKSVLFLADQLKNFNPRVQKQYKGLGEDYGYQIVVNEDFLDYIGGCPAAIQSVYGYKFKKYIKPTKNND